MKLMNKLKISQVQFQASHIPALNAEILEKIFRCDAASNRDCFGDRDIRKQQKINGNLARLLGSDRDSAADHVVLHCDARRVQFFKGK